jgi:GNAT superfamily N-acetyltransferase
MDTIRHATAVDLAPVADIWYEAAFGDERAPPPLRGVPSLYLHELETRELFVLERDGQVVAFAALINRGPLAFLADLFVTTTHRSAGLGHRLLRDVLPRDGRICCTVSSNDPRALPLYVRSGMRPRWPHVSLRADLAQLRALAPEDVEVIEASAEDPELVRWDAEIGGRPRPEDHAYWVRRRGGVPLWFARRGQRVGYGVLQTHSDDLLRSPDAVTLGPIGARVRDDAVACVQAAVGWVREHAKVARISVTGPHPALAPLLRLGFRVTAVETFCSTADESFVDVHRYISSGGDLF